MYVKKNQYWNLTGYELRFSCDPPREQLASSHKHPNKMPFVFLS